MYRVTSVALLLIVGIAFSVFAATFAHSADEGTETVEGTVVCLIPDYGNGTVKPVVASGPCDALPKHQHVLVTKNRVYSLQGLQDGLMKIEQNPQRTNVKITGKPEGSDQTAWVLIVE